MRSRRPRGEGQPSPHRSEPLIDRVLEQRDEQGEPAAADADEPPSDRPGGELPPREAPSHKRLAEARKLLSGIKRTGKGKRSRKR